MAESARDSGLLNPELSDSRSLDPWPGPSGSSGSLPGDIRIRTLFLSAPGPTQALPIHRQLHHFILIRPRCKGDEDGLGPTYVVAKTWESSL